MSDENDDMKAAFAKLSAAHAQSKAAQAEAEIAAAQRENEAQQAHRNAIVAVNTIATEVFDKFRDYLEKELKVPAKVERTTVGLAQTIILRWGPMMMIGGGVPTPAHMFAIVVDRPWTTFRAKSQLKGRRLKETNASATLTAEWVTAALTDAIEESIKGE
jgi:hypothetical protein